MGTNSTVEKARNILENFEEIQPIPVSFSDSSGKRGFFLFPTGFFGLVKYDSPENVFLHRSAALLFHQFVRQAKNLGRNFRALMLDDGMIDGKGNPCQNTADDSDDDPDEH